MDRVVSTLAGVTLFALALALATAPANADEVKNVTVANTPLPVRVVNQPSASPVTAADIAKALGIQHPVSFALNKSTIAADNSSFQVPATQRLIIEYVTGYCRFSNGSFGGLNILVSPSFEFYPVNIPLFDPFNPPPSLTFAHPARIYVAPGSTVQLNALEETATASGAQLACTGFASGQLVDVP